jgi:predicted XRE-type DNA-binding protein
MRKMKRKKLRAMYAGQAPRARDVSTVEAADVWTVICATPEEAADMRARTLLMYGILRTIEQCRWTPAQGACRCGVTEEQMQAIRRGRVSLFTQAELQSMRDKLEQEGDASTPLVHETPPGYESDEGPLSEQSLQAVRDEAHAQMPKGKRLAKKSLC